ncbi:hypothetical protein BDAP_001580 [Binucleata daphniae]
MGIEHIRVGVEAHRSNGRIERVIGTVREASQKNKNGSIIERIGSIVNKHNNTYHIAINSTPAESYDNHETIGILNRNDGI